MINSKAIINQYQASISQQINDDGSIPYLVTITFNMINHVPDHIESDLLNRIKHTKKHDPSSPVLPVLYKELSDYRFKVNGGLNRKIYEKDITYQRLSWIWKQYEIFQTHLVKTLINNAGRSSKIELYPRTFDFVDVFGSKHHNHVWDDDGTIHLHNIYLIRPEISEKFEGLVDQEFGPILWHPKLTGIRGVHAEKVGSGSDDPANVIEYAGKTIFGINPLRQRDDLPLINQFPISTGERLLRKRHAQAQAADRSPS